MVEPRQLAEVLQRVEDPGMGYPAFTKNGWNAPQLDIGGLAHEPLLERGLQLIAIRAAVPEEFDDFDATCGRDRLLGNDAVLVVHPRLPLLSHRSRDRAEREKAQHREKSRRGYLAWDAPALHFEACFLRLPAMS